MAIYMYNTGIQ